MHAYIVRFVASLKIVKMCKLINLLGYFFKRLKTSFVFVRIFKRTKSVLLIALMMLKKYSTVAILFKHVLPKY